MKEEIMRDIDSGVYYEGEKAVSLDFSSTLEFVVREGTTYVDVIGGGYSDSDYDIAGTLIIPESVASIGYLSVPLRRIEIDENNENYCSIDGVLFSKDKKILIRYPRRHDGERYIVPDGVETIAEGAFHSCEKLTNVVLPDTVGFIGEDAFSHTPLEKAELVARPTTIEELAFTPNLYSRHGKEGFANTVLYFKYNDYCIPLPLIDNWAITNDGKIIADFIATEDDARKKSLSYDAKKTAYKVFMAFYLAIACKDEESKQYLKRIKKKLSEDELYSSLITQVLDSEKETKKTDSSDSNKKKDPPLSKWIFAVLPDGSYEIEKYKGKDTIIEVPDMFRGMPIKSIGVSAFSGEKSAACRRIEKVIIPEGIEIIKDKAFMYCSNLTEVSLPESLKHIGNYAFNSCYNLEIINIPDSVVDIGTMAFGACDKFKDRFKYI